MNQQSRFFRPRGILGAVAAPVVDSCDQLRDQHTLVAGNTDGHASTVRLGDGDVNRQFLAGVGDSDLLEDSARQPKTTRDNKHLNSLRQRSHDLNRTIA